MTLQWHSVISFLKYSWFYTPLGRLFVLSPVFTASEAKVNYDRAIQLGINEYSNAVFPKVQAETRKLDVFNAKLVKVLM